jgi:hypothetical protein
MKTICAYSYDLDCVVATLIYKWAKGIPNYNFVAEAMSHWRIKKHCTQYVNKKEGLYLFMGFSKDELVAEGCDKEKFKSIQKVNHMPLSSLLYNKFKKTHEFTKEQKMLIAMAIDKHTFKYSNKNSYFVDVLFHKLSSDKFFYTFTDGMTSLDHIAKNLLREDIYRFSQLGEPTLRPFSFENSIAFVGDVSNMLHYEYKYMRKYDTMIVIDTSQKRVYFRNKNENEKVLTYCKTYCDGGGTNDYCSGDITDKFMEDIKSE